VAMAVSLDISNAFNTIPWYRIVEALRCYQIPKYLVEVIKTYLSDRWVEFGRQRGIDRRPVERGVPQGSVLGPIFWITAYDRVLRCPRPLGTEVICYADDTPVFAGSRWWNETANLTEDAVACVIREIVQLELCVSPTKSEVLGFYDDRHRGPPPPGLTIKIGKGKVMVGQRMKYLGLTIDGHCTFEPHFELLTPKVATAANALCGLLANLGGAGLGVRRLYEDVIRFRILYGAPEWAGELSASRRSLALVRGLQRVTVIRIIRRYRTVSYASATVLAASPLPVRAAGLRAQRKIREQEKNATGGTRGHTQARRLGGDSTEHMERLARRARR
jgi:hypothetical protein